MAIRTREIITPEQANDILNKHNKTNRKIKPDTVRQYATDIKMGRWKSGYDPIVINKYGILENGQHRLLAVVKSGVPTEFEIITDAEPAMESYDRGVPRTISDALTIMANREGKKLVQINHKTAITRYIFRTAFNRAKISDRVIYEFINTNDNELDIAISAVSQSDGISKKAPISTACFVALKLGFPQQSIHEFFGIVNSGFPNETWQTSPLILRNEIQENKCGALEERLQLEKCTELAIKDFLAKNPRKRRYNLSNAKSIMLISYANSIKQQYAKVLE